MQKLRKGEMLGIKTLEQLCELLDMQPESIIKYIENKRVLEHIQQYLED